MIFVILIAFLIGLYLFKPYIRQKGYCAFAGVAFVLISGLRSNLVGTDTAGYVKAFNNTPDISFEFLFDLFEEKEALFYTLQSLVKTFTDDYTWLFLIIAAFYGFCSYFMISRLSKNPLISYIMLLSMGYFYFSMAGLRQTVAMSFLMLSFVFITEKKYIKSAVFLLIATGFHIAAWGFAGVYLLAICPFNIIFVAIIAILTLIAYIYGVPITAYLVDIVFGDTRDYSTAEFGGISTLILLIVIVIGMLLFNKGIYKKEEGILNIDSLMLKMLFFSIPLQTLAIYQANAFRIAMIYHIVSIIAIPNTIDCLDDKPTKTLSGMAVAALLLLQFFAFTYGTADIIPYTFFWEV